MPPEIFAKAGGKHKNAPVATPIAELADYDAIIFGTPTRFGNMSGQMRTFLDQTGGLWASGARVRQSFPAACSVLPERAAAVSRPSPRPRLLCPSWDGDRPG